MVINIKIYDCFTFYNELDLLEIRLNELDSVVDYFVIVEATKTQTGIDKPLYFDINKDRYTKFKHKIIHIIVRDMPDITKNSAWVLENHQRNQIIKGLNNCNLDDIIIISDLDEIPNKKDFPRIINLLTIPENIVDKIRNDFNVYIFKLLFKLNTPELSFKNKVIRKLYLLFEQVNPNTRVIKLRQKWYYYYLNGDANHSAIDTRLLTYRTLITDLNSEAHNTRYMFFGHRIESGWHFSYLEDLKLKVNSIADSVDNTERVTFITDKKMPVNIVEIDKTFPEYIVNNQEKYKKYIKVLKCI